MADLAITAVKTTSKPQPVAIQAGEALAAFDVIYVNSSTQKGFKADASDSSKLAVKYIVLTAAALDEYATCIPLDNNVVLELTGPTLTVAARYVLSSTAGKIAPYADLVTNDYLVEIGVGKTAAQLLTNVQNTGIQVP